MNVFMVRYGKDSGGGGPEPDFIVCKNLGDAYQILIDEGRDMPSIIAIEKLNKSVDDVFVA